MTSPAKLYAKLLANPAATVSYRDFERMLFAFGFAHERTRGSHRAYIHSGIRRSISVQPRGTDAKPYQVREFMSMVETYGLSIA